MISFSLFLKLSSACWACWGTAWGGKGLAPNTDAVFAPGIICLLEENWKVLQHLWANTGRYEAKVSPPELVAGFRAEKTSLVNETLDALSQLSNSPSVLYFESAPDAVFRKPTPPPPLPPPPPGIQHYVPWGYRSHAHTPGTSWAFEGVWITPVFLCLIYK